MVKIKDSLPVLPSYMFGVSNIAEVKVILYVQYRMKQDLSPMVHITVSDFVQATGLSDRSIQKGISRAIQDGYITCEVDDTDKGRIIKKYALTRPGDIPTKQPEQVIKNNAVKVEKQKVKHHNTRARNARLPATLTIEQWIATLDFFEWRCAYCYGEYTLLEHFIPMSHGKGTTWDNCVPSCGKCNMLKQGWHPFLEWGPDMSSIKSGIDRVRSYLLVRENMLYLTN